MMVLSETAPSSVQARPADEAAVMTIVESVGVLADTRNFEALEALFADEVTVDYSTLSEEAAALKSPSTLMSEWAATLPGFDRTRHALSDVEASVLGDSATARANVVAGHWIDGAYWEVAGHYDYALIRGDQGWRITEMTFTLEDETGSRDVFGPAMEAAAATPPSYVIRQQTRQAVIDFLQGIEQKDMARVNGVWAEDAVQDMPFNTEGTPRRVVGRQALIDHYAGWPENAEHPNFTSGLVFYPMRDPHVVFAEFRGQADIVPTGREYRQTYGGLFHVNDAGKITLFREYYDPRVFQYAFAIGETTETE
ncbi:nuclear transport factor 2 family protein [Roseovarius sp. C03]|uniref:nuclear transport factor 2 family protein n=1 Tax=Roseovarius sp. C03 TaxID=3449222 RepID=UPI003EDBF141